MTLNRKILSSLILTRMTFSRMPNRVTLSRKLKSILENDTYLNDAHIRIISRVTIRRKTRRTM